MRPHIHVKAKQTEQFPGSGLKRVPDTAVETNQMQEGMKSVYSWKNA